MAILRFKNKDGRSFVTPEEYVLADLFDKIKTVNKNGMVNNVITNSAEHGLIPQRDFFDKDIAVEGNTNKYTVIHKGDFVYNPRKSSTAPYGPFNCYNYDEEGIVSPLYSCLTPKNDDYTPYLLYYFESPAWHFYIYQNGNQGGARHDRVGMTDALLKGIPVILPCIEEQKKLTEFFDTLDNTIKVQSKKIDALEKRKKGLLHDIFDGTIRFVDENNKEFSEWQSIEIKDILIEYKETCEKNGTYPHASLTKEGVIAKSERYNRDHLVTHDDKKYRITRYNDICYNPANLKFGVICRNTFGDAIFSPIYVTFKVRNNFIPEFVESLLTREEFITYALQFQEGSIYERMAVNPKDLLQIEVDVPELKEQEKISKFFGLINRQIALEKEKLERYKIVKKGLLQKMFG